MIELDTERYIKYLKSFPNKLTTDCIPIIIPSQPHWIYPKPSKEDKK